MAGYIGPIPVPQATQNRETFTATASQTSFATVGYQSGYLSVFMNGVKLVDGSDYTATNGSDVVLATGAAVNDIIEVVSYSAFEVLNQNFTGTTVVDDLTVGGDLTVTGTTITLDHANAQTVDLGDNDKIRLGDGDDLQLYHDGGNSYIKDTGTGDLRIWADNPNIATASGNKIFFGNNGAAELYYTGGSKKLATTSFGAQITGSLAVDTITNASSGTDVTIDTNFDIILDAGGNVGIGTNSPTVLLDLESANPIIRLTDSDASGTPECQISGAGGDLIFDADRDNEKASSVMSFKVDGSEAMHIDSSGNLIKTGGGLISSNGTADTLVISGSNAANTGGNITLEGNTASDASQIKFKNGSTEVMRIAGGRVIIPDGVTLGTAAGVYTAANTLDDYEEGSWTPATSVNGFTQSIASYSGAIYTKIGNVVRVRCRIHLSANGYASGYSRITGLPFSNAYNSAFGRYTSGAISDGGNGGAIYVGSSDIYLFKTFGNTASSAQTYLWPLDFSYITNS